jgi:hypothetical protein
MELSLAGADSSDVRLWVAIRRKRIARPDDAEGIARLRS